LGGLGRKIVPEAVYASRTSALAAATADIRARRHQVRRHSSFAMLTKELCDCKPPLIPGWEEIEKPIREHHLLHPLHRT